MDGDLVVNLPLSDIYEQHVKSGADITVVCGNDSFETENGTYFEMDGTGRVTDVLYHLHRPRGYRGLEVYLLSTKLLLDLVDECATRDQYSLRRDVLQARKDSLKLQGYIWGGFAAQAGRLLRELSDRRRLQHRGRGGELHPLPRRGGGGRRGGAQLRAVQGDGGAPGRGGVLSDRG